MPLDDAQMNAASRMQQTFQSQYQQSNIDRQRLAARVAFQQWLPQQAQQQQVLQQQQLQQQQQVSQNRHSPAELVRELQRFSGKKKKC